MINFQLFRDKYNSISQFVDRMAANTPQENQAIIAAIAPQIILLKSDLERVNDRQIEEVELLSSELNKLCEKVETTRSQILGIDSPTIAALSEQFFTTLPADPTKNEAEAHFMWIEKEIATCKDELNSRDQPDPLKKLEKIEAQLNKLKGLLDLGDKYKTQRDKCLFDLKVVSDDVAFLKIKELYPKLEVYLSERAPITEPDPKLIKQIKEFISRYYGKPKSLERSVTFEKTLNIYSNWNLKGTLEKYSEKTEQQFQLIMPLCEGAISFNELDKIIKAALTDFHEKHRYIRSSLSSQITTISKAYPFIWQKVVDLEQSFLDKAKKYNEILQRIGSSQIEHNPFMKDFIDLADQVEKDFLNDVFDGTKIKKLEELKNAISQALNAEITYWKQILPNREMHVKIQSDLDRMYQKIDEVKKVFAVQTFLNKFSIEINSLKDINTEESYQKSALLRKKLKDLESLTIFFFGKDKFSKELSDLKNKIDQMDYGYFVFLSNQLTQVELSNDINSNQIIWNNSKTKIKSLHERLQLLSKNTNNAALKNKIEFLESKINANETSFLIKLLLINNNQKLLSLDERFQILTNPERSKNLALDNKEYKSLFKDLRTFEKEVRASMKEALKLNKPEHVNGLTPLLNKVGILIDELKSYSLKFNPPLSLE